MFVGRMERAGDTSDGADGLELGKKLAGGLLGVK